MRSRCLRGWRRARGRRPDAGRGRLVRAHGSDTLSFFKLRSDQHYFFSRDGEAFVGYRVENYKLLVFTVSAMMAGVAGIAFSLATSSEQTQWKQAAHREGQRYNIESEFVDARMNGRQSDNEERPSRTAIDWLLVAAATAK